MGHHICAIIGKDTISKDKVKEFGLAVAFEEGYAIVLLDQELMHYWYEKLDIDCFSEDEEILYAGKLAFHFADQLGLSNYAIIQTDYFGGIGEQYANTYDKGKEILHEVSINQALKELGVVAAEGKDEFDTLNLAEYRATEFYYWSQNNFADKRDNMIAGHVPGAY